MKAMRSTRDKILQTLLRHPRSSINDLADAVGINPVSVRHHLTNLQVEGLVTADEERHGVGRPRLVYLLTEDGLERFPTRYLRLTTRLLSQMKEQFAGPVVGELFTQVANDLVEQHEGQLETMNTEQRLHALQDVLAEEGFVVEWEKRGQEYLIHEITCPYLQVGQTHPEVCTVDQTLISRMLDVPAERVECILSGAAHCTYVVNLGSDLQLEK
jgi:predicted ArsR family transcriptional regulator